VDVEAMFKIGETSATPGETFAVPFMIHATREVQAYSLSVDFDEEVLQATAINKIFEKPDGTDYSFEKFEYNNQNETPGNGGIDEGFLIGAAVFSFLDSLNNLPADQDNEVLSFHFEVDPSTTASVTEIAFLEGGQASGQPVQNLITTEGYAVSPLTTNSFILLNGLIKIRPEITEFIRGDANGDKSIDLTDARVTLSFLFLGEHAPHCLDASDFNDDGILNISDPIATLLFKFLGGPPPPTPWPDAGKDPTSDAMNCHGWY
jgi:hypothetical protein